MSLRRPSPKWVLASGLLALAYFVAGKAGLRLAFLQPSVSPVWPPAGIALAALLALGLRAWPAIFVGAFFVNLTTAGDLGTSLAIAAGNTLEAVCGAWMVSRYAGGVRVFDRAQDVFRFALIAPVSTAISPSIGLSSLALAGFVSLKSYHWVWFTWWVGDMTGYLVIAPLVLLWWVGPRPQWSARQKMEGLALFILLVLVGESVFGGWFEEIIRDYPLAFICGPIILWTAFRFGPLETTTGIFILTGIALWGTLHHFGPYRLATDNQSLLALQSWAGVLTLTSMTLAAAMTERRRVEAELEQQKETVEAANRTKDNFLAMLSHELRTPLTPVISFLDLLEAEPDKSERMQTGLATIRRNINIERRLIDDLLDLTRISRGKLMLELKPTDAHEAIAQVVEMCEPDAAEKKLRVERELRATSAWVAADSAKFQQIIWNLLKNAIKFTPDGGRIVIASENETPDSLTIEVRDNGIGITPEALGRVFNAFEQGDQSFKHRHGGLGLGLAISKAIADGHGGTLAAASEGHGRGATLRLTMETTEPAAMHGNRAATGAKTSGRQLRILLVDDHADTCAALEKLLARRGHRVMARRDVGSALEAASRNEFDLLISDVGLPDGSGMDLMTCLKTRGVLRGIAISGFGTNGDRERSLKAGFAEHLTKPVNFERLERTIEEVIGDG